MTTIEIVSFSVKLHGAKRGNQGKMHKRREFLSSRKRYYFSTSNTDEKNDNLNNLSLHYGYFNEKPINPININKESNYISRSFELIDL